MPISTQRELPAEIRSLQDRIEDKAREYGLDFFETIFEMVDYEEMSMLAAYGGFPIRYPHWKFGAEYDEMMKSYSYGLSKIYEMVINTDPSYAYLLTANEMADQKLVIAHVYGHVDFFKNNYWFSRTNRRMLDQMANHAARIGRYVDRYGFEEVERMIDCALSIDDLIDPHLPFVDPKDRKKSDSTPDGDKVTPRRFEAKGYMDSFINPPEVMALEESDQKERRRASEESRSFPAAPQRDVLLFLLEHSSLKDWQRDILSIIRDEAYYYAPQGQTKIMNEGWASYWHTTIMTQFALDPSEVVTYADHHSGTMATSPQRLNPYKLGIELFRDIEERWDKGQFGLEWEQCDDVDRKENWNLDLGLGREKIFEVRRIHNDITFIDEFLTPEFCAKHKMFSFAYNDSNDFYEIASREFQKIKQQLLTSLTNHGRPVIRVVDGNFGNRGELLLKHEFQGIELRQDYARDVMQNLELLWGRPVNIETVIDEEPALMTFDGEEHDVAPM
ncbi:SpoVR family protein [Stratiformator vulcanicus]|uniref:SpoVR family protein n=1 Tax=Stratiformator vulcanicus TaxID=2527980 RepID=A0A517QXK4_9PLAN|nr:SpoVR family protein [Stratiformator vulcanicus]QDT36318.1 SpoVR family protein [Stratiformator vulcanicus]